MFNTELAERVLAQIKDHPETWNQGTWRCGTGMCFAGWACELGGLKWENDSTTELTNGQYADDGAIALLGLDLAAYEMDDDNTSRAGALFAAGNDLEELERLVKHFANNPDDDSLPVTA